MVVASHLRSLQAIELTLRTGSLKAAAATLAITPAAVGQRIKMLEDYLGVDLLARGRSGLAPTAALREALPHLHRAFQELDMVSGALDIQRAGEIQIAAPADWLELWLEPRLAVFRALHPNIRFGMIPDGDARSRQGHADVEVVFASPQGPQAASELLLFRDFVIPITSPENAARIAKSGGKAGLEGFPLLNLDFYRDDPTVPDWRKWIAAHGHRKSAPSPGVRFNRIAPGLSAVLSDAGVMICGLAMILDQLDRGELVLLFPTHTGTWTNHAFVARFRKDALARPQVRRFRDWLEAEAKATRAELERAATPKPRARRKAPPA
jgi:LysR family transcriptional regulator, glycine cleavage system transcriptional activator